MQGAKSVENGEWRGKFFACVVGGVSGPRGVRQDVHPGREEIVRASMAQPSCGTAFFSIECTKKRPKAFFIGCFQMLLPGILWRERHFMQKSNAKPANLENKSLALLSPNCLVAKSFISCIICAAKSHILAFLRCFLEHFYAPIVSPVTRR